MMAGCCWLRTGFYNVVVSPPTFWSFVIQSTPRTPQNKIKAHLCYILVLYWRELIFGGLGGLLLRGGYSLGLEGIWKAPPTTLCRATLGHAALASAVELKRCLNPQLPKALKLKNS